MYSVLRQWIARRKHSNAYGHSSLLRSYQDVTSQVYVLSRAVTNNIFKGFQKIVVDDIYCI